MLIVIHVSAYYMYAQPLNRSDYVKLYGGSALSELSTHLADKLKLKYTNDLIAILVFLPAC
jgi:biotin-(acetyl-CoA carboxylase) ligase